MTYVTHQFSALVLALAYLNYFMGGELLFIPILISFSSALLPDIDEPQSYIGRRLKLISNIFKAFFGHRGFTHSILGFLSFTLLFYFIFIYTVGLPLVAIIFFIMGYAIHLLEDLLTTNGIPLFSPFNNKRFSLSLLKTQGLGEYIFRFIFILLFLYQSFFFLDPRLQALLDVFN